MSVQYTRDKDFFFLANLSFESFEVPDVPCKVYLPPKILDNPRVVFRPSRSQWDQLIHLPYISLQGQVKNPDGSPNTEVFSSRLFISSAKSRYWGPNIFDATIECEPHYLQITQHLESCLERNFTSINFWISPNEKLSPTIVQSTSYTGEVEYNRLSQLEFQLQDIVHLKFDRHFSSSSSEGEFRQWSKLVAESEISFPAGDTNLVKSEILLDLDDLLLLASLGSRTRTTCLGWSAEDRNTLVQFFRRDISVPDLPPPGNSNGWVAPGYFFQFLQETFSSFKKQTNKKAFRSAMFLTSSEQKANFRRRIQISFFGIGGVAI